MTNRILFLLALILSLGLKGLLSLKHLQAQGVQTSPTEKLPSPTPSGPTDHLWEDVKRYGAKGDGKTNDTQAIQKAIEAAVKRGTMVVLLPPGIYVTNDPGLRLTVSGLTFKGLGEYATIIQHSGEQPAIIVGNGKPKPLCLDVKIVNLKIVGKKAQGDGIHLSDYAIRYAIENVCITGFLDGVAIKAVDHNHSGHIARVQLNNNAVGISIGDHGQFTDISFSKIFHNKKFGIELLDCNVINIISTQIEKNGGKEGASLIARGVEALNLIGCYNEQNDIYPAPFLILTRGSNSAFCRAVNLIGCRSIGNKKAPHSVIMESAQDVNLFGNHFRSFSVGIFFLNPLKPDAVRSVSGLNNSFNGPLGVDPFTVK